MESEAIVNNTTAGFADAVKATFRHEEWKYTNLAPLLTLYSQIPSVNDDNVQQPPEPEPSEHRILIVNGVVQTCIPQAELVSKDNPHAAATGKAPSSPFAAFVHATVNNVVQITIPDNTAIPHTIVVDVVTDSSSLSRVSTVSLRIVAEKGASVTVKEQHHGIGTQPALSVSVTEIIAKQDSAVTYVKHTQLPENLRHIGATNACVDAGATVRTHSMCLGGPYVRNDLFIRLQESTAEAYLNGLSVLHGHEIADNHTAVDHLVPRCHSEELYKGIYHDASIGIFNGKIFVRPDAQKTTAYQSSRSLLLGDRAQVNAKPQLEIWADDVKCSHGATTGQLDQEALFYLQSRGLSQVKAKELLVEAFAQEMFDRLP